MRPATSLPWLRHSLVLMAACLFSACATVPPPAGGAPSSAAAIDPWEGWNRKVFAFNDAIDTAVLKPVATVWRDVVPSPIRQGVSNFFEIGRAHV